MEKLVSGLVRFQQSDSQERKALVAAAANGQRSEALFLTCADSCIDPKLLAQTKAGDLFTADSLIWSNAGKIVPPHMKVAGKLTWPVNSVCN
jgi:carbonic anhydrase